ARAPGDCRRAAAAAGAPRLRRAPAGRPAASLQCCRGCTRRAAGRGAARAGRSARVSTAATVLIPTHDHGRTLLRSVPSALAQTVSELEVFVVGDGVPDETRELMTELAAADNRVRFFDNPKGERHGEAHRHAALQEARGEIVCYLSDDDVWLP